MSKSALPKVPNFAPKTNSAAKRPLAVPVIVFCLFWAAPVLAEKLEILRKIPHTGYSEGLDYHEGFLWHALPKEIVKIDPKDGTIVDKFKPGSEYSESVVWIAGKLFNVSFSDNGIYVGGLVNGKLNFERKGTTPEIHSWGLTYDGKHLIMTGNYSDTLYYYDPKTLKKVRELKTNKADLEDLAWDGKGIWTSSFTTDKGSIFRIDPKTGKAGKTYALPSVDDCPIIDGIAYDGKNLWITGKNCLSLYYVNLPKD